MLLKSRESADKVLRRKIRITKNKLYILLIAVLLFTGCKQEDAAEMVETDVVPIRLSLPISSSDNMSLRARRKIIGDPGVKEEFLCPRYAYVFVVIDKVDGTQQVISITDYSLDSESWRQLDYSGSLNTAGDPIFMYTRNINVSVAKEQRRAGRVYIAASYVPLTLSNSAPSTELEVQGITFTVDDALQSNLQHIYTTPYNYCPDGTTYYGTLERIDSKVPTVNVLLYHVASKVDVMWSVPQSLRADMKISGVSARNLFVGQAYLFKPNAVRSAILSSGYTRTLATNSASTWWEGRQYFYTIPYQTPDGKFPLQIDYNIQTLSTDTYSLTVLKNMNGADQVFTPWMRCQMTFSEPKSGTETKNVD